MKTSELVYQDKSLYKGREINPSDLDDLGNLYKKHWVLLVKLKKLGIIRGEYSDTNFTVRNPYSHREATINGLAYDLYRWIVEPGPLVQERSLTKLRLADWREALVLFRLCWPDEYFILLD